MHHPRRAALIAATSIFFIRIIASNARFASSPPAASASVRTRGVICQETPHLSLHQPQALSCPPLPTIASSIGRFPPDLGRDLEGERFGMFERRTAVEPDAWDAGYGELDRQHITLLAGREITGARCTAPTALSGKVAA